LLIVGKWEMVGGAVSVRVWSRGDWGSSGVDEVAREIVDAVEAKR